MLHNRLDTLHTWMKTVQAAPSPHPSNNFLQLKTFHMQQQASCKDHRHQTRLRLSQILAQEFLFSRPVAPDTRPDES